MKRVGIIETALGDAARRPAPRRVDLHRLLPAVESADSAGFYSIECWGGAVFDSCLRFLNEDPWARLRAVKEKAVRTELQMPLRGQSLIGYKQYPDDVVRAFVRRARECGIGLFRVYDPLNDLKNMETAVDEALRAGALVSGAVCFSASPVHSLDTFMALAKKLKQMGCHSVCLMDEGGIMTPRECSDLIYALERGAGLPVIVHARSFAGIGALTAMKAVEAGAAAIDCAAAGASGEGGLPATEAMSCALMQTGFDTGLDPLALKRLHDYIRGIQGPPAPAGDGAGDGLPQRIPAQMVRGIAARLTAQKALHRLPEVLAEAGVVRGEIGFPPLVTPISQIIAAQAAENVLGGRRYASISREIRAIIAGEYGKPPGEIERELRRLALDGRNPPAVRFADVLEPGLEKARAEIGHLARSADDVLSYAVFPQLAEQFLKKRGGKG